MQSTLITLNGVQFHHLEWAGDNPPVVFLPGFIASATAALNLAKTLAPQRRVLAFDLRGRGQSDKPGGGYGIAQHLDDTHQRLETMGLDRFILAGHSFGAALALLFADRYPAMVEKIILFDGGAIPSEGAMQLFHWYHSNLTYQYPSVEAYLTPYREMITLQPWSDEAEALIRSNIEEQPDGTALRTVPPHVVQAELGQISAADWQPLQAVYPRIQVPVLLIRAGMGSFSRDDQHITDAVLQTMTLTNLQVYEMPDAGHTGILTVPDAGRDQAIRDFVMKD